MRFNKCNALGSAHCSGIGDEWLERCRTLGVLILVVSASKEGEFGLKRCCWREDSQALQDSCCKIKAQPRVMKNKRREVQCVTIYGTMVILPPMQIFNLYPAPVVGSNL